MKPDLAPVIDSFTLNQPIYKIDNDGRIREWKIAVIDHGTHAEILTLTGLQGSPNHVPSSVMIYEGKNIGKANETTYYEQAVKDALSAAKLKLREEYRIRQEDARPQELSGGIKAPMLAKVYDPSAKIKGSKTLAKMKIHGHTVHVQPKYDGVRCMAKINLDGCQFYTRKGDVMPVKLPHIEEQLFESYKNAGLTDEIILDGEAFSDEISFSKLNGLLNSKKPLTPAKQLYVKDTYYVLFDVYSDNPYRERHNALQPFASQDVRIIPTHEIMATDDAIRAYMDTFLEEGHEGLMIRQLKVGYEHKRTWNLIKYKDWIESEFVLLGIEEESRGGGLIGGFVLEMEDKSHVDSNGKPILTFKAGCALSRSEQREFTANIKDHIGGLATIKYQLVKGDPRPRFGKFKSMRYDI